MIQQRQDRGRRARDVARPVEDEQADVLGVDALDVLARRHELNDFRGVPALGDGLLDLDRVYRRVERPLLEGLDRVLIVGRDEHEVGAAPDMACRLHTR